VVDDDLTIIFSGLELGVFKYVNSASSSHVVISDVVTFSRFTDVKFGVGAI